METKPAPSESDRQSTVPVVLAIRHPKPIWQPCGRGREIHQENSLGTLDVATYAKAPGNECLKR
jgi:hypothetical protein